MEFTWAKTTRLHLSVGLKRITAMAFDSALRNVADSLVDMQRLLAGPLQAYRSQAFGCHYCCGACALSAKRSASPRLRSAAIRRRRSSRRSWPFKTAS